MFTIVTPEEIQLPPGSVVWLLGSWHDYITITLRLAAAFSITLMCRCLQQATDSIVSVTVQH